MGFFRSIRATIVAISFVFLLFTTSACSGASHATLAPSAPSSAYTQLEQGNTPAGQTFGNWVVKTSGGLIDDAYVRDNDKLGVVVSRQVRPAEVRSLARSLVQGFQKNFPNRDVRVMMYAPDKQLILTAKYNHLTRQIEYQ